MGKILGNIDVCHKLVPFIIELITSGLLIKIKTKITIIIIFLIIFFIFSPLACYNLIMKRYINKIYDELKRFIKENYIGIIFLILFACFCFYDTGYSIYRPGGTINATSRVNGDNIYESKGTFNMAYVSMMKGRLPFYLLAKVIPTWELIKNESFTMNDTEDINDAMARDTLEYKSALSNAMYVAFNSAKVKYDITSSSFYVLFKTDKNDSDLKVGNEVISYDDNRFKDTKSFIDYINSKEEGYKINIKYLDNKKEKETTSTIYKEDDKLYVGLSILNLIDIKSDYNIKVETKGSESGPSGGFITALAIYNALTPEDITKGKKIVGTGTISLDGTVGEIGAIEYKLAAAVKKKADIFLCPKENYESAIKYAKKQKYDIIIKDISSFDEAIDYLNSLEGV